MCEEKPRSSGCLGFTIISISVGIHRHMRSVNEYMCGQQTIVFVCVCVCFEDAAMFIYRLCVRDEVYWYMTIYALSHLTIDTLSLIYLDNCIVMISDKMG